ncbi:MAG: polyprenyl synthetase family protein, partial [Clostridia bacterium]|nr:polyprenyl synthetase family protein [Clostridia bacterium]
LLPLIDAETYSLFGGGKRIRPFLVFEFCRMLGGEERAAAPFACAIEMIHTYSLIHDDLPCMDDDTDRRGRLTCHKMFDEATAVLSGDALLTGAFGVAAGNPYVTPKIARDAAVLLSESAGAHGMVGGQILDMAAEKHSNVSINDVLRLHSLKTGALIRAAARLGCLAAGKSAKDEATLAADRYAAGIGLAFQIVDDVLDVEGDPEKLGKATGADAKMNKVTFMNFYSVKEAKAYAAKLTEQAIGAISDMPNHETLCELAEYLLERKY